MRLAHRKTCEMILQVHLEQLLGALPMHLLAVLLGRQAPDIAAARADSRPISADVEPAAAVPAGTDGQPPVDGLSGLPAAYLKKGLVALSNLADLAARTPLAMKLEVIRVSHVS